MQYTKFQLSIIGKPLESKASSRADIEKIIQSGNSNSASLWSASHHSVVDYFPTTTNIVKVYSLLIAAEILCCE